MTRREREDLLDAIRAFVIASERRRQRSASAAGIAMTDLTALIHLRPRPLSQRELADRLAITSSSATVLVDRLARRQLAERRADPDDRRKSMVALLPAGERIALQVRESYRAAVDQLPDEDLAGFTAALRKVAGAAEPAAVMHPSGQLSLRS
jgi:DNA-binding MarR family transcriptional regulator